MLSQIHPLIQGLRKILLVGVFASIAVPAFSWSTPLPLPLAETQSGAMKTEILDEASGTQAIEDEEIEEIPKSIGRTNGLTLNETVIVDNRMRQSLVYLPCGYHSEENDKRPLVIVLHGSRLNGTIAKAVTKFDALACDNDFIVAYPNALYKQWNDGRGKIHELAYGEA
jgi:hypothetical protein